MLLSLCQRIFYYFASLPLSVSLLNQSINPTSFYRFQFLLCFLSILLKLCVSMCSTFFRHISLQHNCVSLLIYTLVLLCSRPPPPPKLFIDQLSLFHSTVFLK
ncbi:unnamed protein product, partial [Heterobilharzia americana]